MAVSTLVSIEKAVVVTSSVGDGVRIVENMRICVLYSSFFNCELVCP